MKIGLVGAKLSGKSTLFQAITKIEPDPSKYHGIKPQPGIVKVPDARLDFLTEMYNPAKKVHAITEFLDFQGIELGSRTETMKSLLAEMRNLADALILVLKGFDGNDFAKDFTELLTEFLFADLEIIEKRIAKLEISLKRPLKTHKEDQKEIEFLQRLQKHLEETETFEGFEFSADEEKSVRGFRFLTQKAKIVVLNTDDVQGADLSKIPGMFAINADIENEIRDMSAEEQAEFLSEYNITELSTNPLIVKAFDVLNIMRFYTVGEDECRAWEVKRDANAVEAAGCIHTDLARGFIRAEVFNYDDLHEFGSEKEVKANGKLRIEGKDYIVKDGDIINVRFSV